MLGWTWLDGKKTNIAAALLIGAAILDQVVGGIWGVRPVLDDAGQCAANCWLPPTTATLEWIGMALGATGLAHKGVKLIGQPKPE